ncbi:tetratricopeptide repeat-containing sensor histidine kinase [Flavobacterium phragmitis]|uniref:Tetratricopeptide repeat-containing protein n=1 Tax=Flavobacterium phragmitis TaxID=739143 RepID=A0A1I1JLX3_9FLAO|nr:histidine kinase [Flavobacterium phragmitis]SFC49365.1 Tetratricopeptide repeat-containing protein [Flavobacterium phragmitis]
MKRSALIVFSLFFVMLLVPQRITAQAIPSKKMEKSSSKISKTADELSKSLDENDESKIAQNYERLANEFLNNGDNAKAEEYFKRALNSYTKLKLTEDKTRVTRSLAKAQENQKNFGSAIKNYEKAGSLTKDAVEEKINLNDANRLKNQSDPASQADYVDSNIDLLKKENKKGEVKEAYVQKAQNSLQLNDKKVAIESYNKALDYTKNKPEEAIKIKNEIAKVYAEDNQFDKALLISEKILAEARKNKDYTTEIKQLQSLSSIYFEKKEPEKAISSLKEAYDLSFQKGNSAEAKKSLSSLVKYYKTKGQDKKSMALYEQFFDNFDKLIHSDTTLIDAKTFQITEEKIRQLEKEKTLKDELISKKNTFNYFLIGSVGLLLLLFMFIVKALYSIKIKNKEIALQSLRREMNPHFIFNSLNSVNQFISENKELEANKYLTSYSNLMRNMMENSNKDFISLDKEVEQLKKYLDLEHLRFEDKFDFEITVDDSLDPERVFVPNMILQPHLENAIWHGLRYLDKKGFLSLRFDVKNEKIIVTIEDNGIGLTKSGELKTKNQKIYESRGLNNTKERIALLNELYKKEITFRIVEKEGLESGTMVQIVFPLIDKI